MKQIKFFSLILAALLLAGCGNDEPTAEPIDAVITVAASAFSINNAAGSEATATFTVNTDWTTAVSYEGTAQEWLSVAPQSGRAGEDVEITLKATAENTSDANRIAYVDICYADKTHRLTITQTIDPNIDITARFDTEFAKILKERGYIPNAENIKFLDVKDIKKIDVSQFYPQRGNLTTLSGLEYFSALDTLDCYFNRLTSLDVSKNTMLTYLNCAGNQLTDLDVSGCTALSELGCDNNQLTDLDVSNNTALTSLGCGGNQLVTLYVSGCTALTGLNCDFNQLTALDVNKNTALTSLSCHFNQLIALDVSNNTVLNRLACDNNQLTVLDVSNCTALTFLHCIGNQLTTLDVSNNTVLTDLECGYNQLAALDISKNTALAYLFFGSNPGNGAVFPVTAWFDNSSVPSNFPQGSWDYNGNTISIDYIKEN